MHWLQNLFTRRKPTNSREQERTWSVLKTDHVDEARLFAGVFWLPHRRESYIHRHSCECGGERIVTSTGIQTQSISDATTCRECGMTGPTFVFYPDGKVEWCAYQ